MGTGTEVDVAGSLRGSVDPVWGPYPNYQDIARLEYGQLLWKNPRHREKLLRMWTHPEHPYAERFARQRGLIEEVLESPLSRQELDTVLRTRGHSLRAVVREIPPAMAL